MTNGCHPKKQAKKTPAKKATKPKSVSPAKKLLTKNVEQRNGQ